MKQSTLLDLVDSDSDDGLLARISVPRITEKMPAAKGSRGRTAANRVQKTESKTETRRAGAKKASAAEKEIERQALAESAPNEQPKGTRGRKKKQPTGDVDEVAEDVLATPPGSDEPARKKGGRGRPKKEAVIPDSVQKKDPSVAARRGRKVQEAEESVSAEEESSEIPETQEALDLMDVDGEEDDQVEDLPVFSRFSAPPSAHRQGTYHMPSSASKRSSNSLDHESDPSIRRRLGEMTKKYEALEAKYKDLKNVAVTEAEKTFDRLRKTSEERAQSTSGPVRTICDVESTTDVVHSLQSTYLKPQERVNCAKATCQGRSQIAATT